MIFDYVGAIITGALLYYFAVWVMVALTTWDIIFVSIFALYAFFIGIYLFFEIKERRHGKDEKEKPDAKREPEGDN